MPASKMLDLTGNVYGRLTVEHYVGKRGKLHYWSCRCSCGGTTTASRNNLKSGRIQSCGCLLRERTIQRSTVHGASAGGRWTREYTTWNSMRKRCNNPRRKEWRYYGGKGVRVCDRWNSFANFLADMGPCPDGYTIERKDGNGNYEPDNCIWATRATQSRNRSNVKPKK